MRGKLLSVYHSANRDANSAMKQGGLGTYMYMVRRVQVTSSDCKCTLGGLLQSADGP